MGEARKEACKIGDIFFFSAGGNKFKTKTICALYVAFSKCNKHTKNNQIGASNFPIAKTRRKHKL